MVALASLEPVITHDEFTYLIDGTVLEFYLSHLTANQEVSPKRSRTTKSHSIVADHPDCLILSHLSFLLSASLTCFLVGMAQKSGLSHQTCPSTCSLNCLPPSPLAQLSYLPISKANSLPEQKKLPSRGFRGLYCED